MNRTVRATANRSEQVEQIASRLLAQVALLRRLLARQLGDELSRTNAGILNTLSDGPRRITELAELEGLAQPTTTILVKQLERQGLVRRERQADDGRVVLVYVTETGAEALREARERAGAALRSALTEMSNQQIEALAAATEALQELIVLLRHGPAT
jgi:DNA-binding MarR family transcriptional regulator